MSRPQSEQSSRRYRAAPLTEAPEPRVRNMRLGDIAKVMAVERAAYPFPWTEGIFRDCLRVGYCCRVVVQARALIGHGVMTLGAGECHLLNICIHPAQQRQGLGRALVQHLLDIARESEATMALLEVRRSNLAAYRLYTGLGFDEIGIRRHYYPTVKGREDAIVLAKALYL